MKIAIKAVTKGPCHHFFGFHDLVQSNAKGDLLLGLEVDQISRPPYPGEKARAGVIFPYEQRFELIHETCAFNYPQGARQQWVGESDLFVCNDLVGDAWGAHLSDARERKVIETFPFPVHCLDAGTGATYSIDYSRLHRVGGYGYTGLPDKFESDDIPCASGIFKSNIKSGETELLFSVEEVALCSPVGIVKTGFPHYLTHLLLSPDNQRIAFLHRYRVADGGEITRLMTGGVDGKDLRCIAKGFLSHYEWLDNDHVFIWGEHQGFGCSLRERSWIAYPGVSSMVQVAKGVIRLVRKQKKGAGNQTPSRSFLKVKDSPDVTIAKVAVGVLTEDGHPMCSPAERAWLVNDTYPDDDGARTLMLYDRVRNRRIDLGRFRMLDDEPDVKEIDVARVLEGVDVRVRRKFPLDQYLFTRSGYHCDLHPRWSFDGNSVLFDSIHEGSRQIYMADVSAVAIRDKGSQ